MNTDLTRRQWLAGTAGLAGVGAAGRAAPAAPLGSRGLLRAAPQSKKPFRFMLNTATIMGQKLNLVEQVEVAAKAGYDAFEPWIRDLEAHVKAGKSLKDVAKRITDHGLTVESAIGFAPWLVDDDTQRKKGLEQARRDMDLVKQLGGSRIAAPPAGATDRAGLDLLTAAARYRALC